MKTKLVKLTLGTSLLLGLTVVNAQKMNANIVHGTPWVETRLAYGMTVQELAEKYYGNSTEAIEIVKKNKRISNSATFLSKDMLVSIPVTRNFTDQPELLGWIE